MNEERRQDKERKVMKKERRDKGRRWKERRGE